MQVNNMGLELPVIKKKAPKMEEGLNLQAAPAEVPAKPAAPAGAGANLDLNA